ncbi:MAG: flagellar basal body-associated protein FliL [Pseudohongiellaceae bacterium]
MAEETDEKELNLDEGDETSSDTPPKSKKKLIIGALIALLLIGGGAAYYFLFASAPIEDEIPLEEVQVPVEEAFYLAVSPVFVVNLPDRGKQRFLQVSVTLMTRDESILLKIEQHMPVIRHHLTNVLSAQTIASIQSAGGIQKVRVEALEKINSVLSSEFATEAVEEVLFTSFVMQ